MNNLTRRKLQTRQLRKAARAAHARGAKAAHGNEGRQRRSQERKDGFALLLSIIAIAILSVLVTDLHETTGTSFAAAMSERDQLRAEFMAKSGVNLTRMLIGQERSLRQLVDPIYRMLLQRSAPQLPVWQFAEMILAPFSDFESSKEDVASAGFDLGMAEGLGNTHASFEIAATAENGKVNLNDPQVQDAAVGHASVAALLYSLTGGVPSPNKLDALFSQFDEKGRLTTRLDVVASVIDWWDLDEQRTNWDPLTGAVTATGGEDTDYYHSLPEPYRIKNAPFDTIEELRLVRGVTDDFWATFVEPELDDPKARQVTIYGAAKVNPNEAPPQVMLARLCTWPQLHTQLLCMDPIEQMKFTQVLSMARSLAPIPWFSRASDFVNFVTGKPEGLYGKLQSILGGGALGALMGGGAGGAGGGGGILFTPMVIPDEVAPQVRRTFTTTARFITIEVTGISGNAQRRIRTVINTDPKWTPPQGVNGKLPPLGIFAYYRMD